MVFATLMPGATASVDELLAFTAARVDEAPAKPKWVTVIDTMPMTNVGKIYKPELRSIAARQVAVHVEVRRGRSCRRCRWCRGCRGCRRRGRWCGGRW